MEAPPEPGRDQVLSGVVRTPQHQRYLPATQQARDELHQRYATPETETADQRRRRYANRRQAFRRLEAKLETRRLARNRALLLSPVPSRHQVQHQPSPSQPQTLPSEFGQQSLQQVPEPPTASDIGVEDVSLRSRQSRKRKTRNDVESAIQRNEQVNATPAEQEDGATRKRRRNRRQVARRRLHAELTSIESRIGRTSLDANEEVESTNQGRDPNTVERERLAAMSPGTRVVYRARRSTQESVRRANMTDAQRTVERERHSQQEAQRRANLTDPQRAVERERHSQQEAQRRRNMTEQEREEYRLRQSVLDAARVTARSTTEREQRRVQQAAWRDQREPDAVIADNERRRYLKATRRHKYALKNHECFDIDMVSGKNVVDGRHILPDPNVICSSCNAWKWPGETKTGCCIDGRVLLDPLAPAPNELKTLLQDENFRKNIRAYNQVMAFTSLGASCDENGFHPVREDRTVQGQRGIFSYRIQGAMGHYLGSLLPRTDAFGNLLPPQFAQIYIFDPDIEQRVARRRGIFSDLDRVALMDLEQMMQQLNPFAQQYLRMGEVLREMMQDGSHPVDVVFRLHANDQAGRGTHNLPTTSEVAAVLIEDGNAAHHRDLVLRTRSSGLMRLFETRPEYDPLQYPILFPYGELGWTYTLKYANGRMYRKKDTMALREFVANRLYQKVGDQSILHDGGRLFQQWVVDQRAKCEQENLRWIASHQQDIRADLYKGVQDAYFNADADHQSQDAAGASDFDRHTGQQHDLESGRPTHFLDQVGQRIILPATFTGSDRYMYSQYLDSMAMVRELGKPDLFMTVTCNPMWEEIVEAIGPNRTAQDRPDIVARVWQQKLKAVLQDLDDGVLGHQIARIHVIEFQKRGLPHAHILIILADEDKPKTQQDYDNFVSAELPDPEKYPQLYQTVLKTMIHGPCGTLNSGSPCMKNEKCSKNYPKPLSEVTQTNRDGYPVYRRRQRPNGILEFNGKQYDNATINQWVVPYNPYFSQKFDCHINLEVCSTILAIMYLYKYVYKGSDKTTISAQGVRNEIGEAGQREQNEIIRYLSARYISPIEACMRLFEYPIQAKTHTVVTLNVHLPDSHFVTYRPTDNPADVLASNKHTKLTRFFELCRSDDPADAPAKTMIYQDIPKLFRWDKTAKIWVRYKQFSRSIGRLVHCSPQDKERYFLRVMLRYRKGPTSYEDLRTVDGYVCATFYEAAEKAGYLENDREWNECLREASLFHMPSQLRQLFATILVYSMPSKCDQLWEEFYDYLSRDYEREFHERSNKEQMVRFHTLLSLNKFLMASGSSLSEWKDLPQLSEFPELLREALMGNDLIQREISYNQDELQSVISQVDSLNDNQRKIYDDITQAALQDQPRKRLFFIDGPGGTGKSTLIKHILAKVRVEGKIALAVASSGIASLLIPGGRTAHSMFKIPLNPTSESMCFIKKQSKLASLIRQASLIVWDEAPMTHRYAFEAVSRTLQDIMDRKFEPFGGKVMVLSGDFRQILPVVKKGSPADTLNACLKSSELWPQFTQMHLTTNMRVLGAANSQTAAELEAFAEFLLEVGEGRHQSDPKLGKDFMKVANDILIDNPPYDPALEHDEASTHRPIPLGLQRIVDAMYRAEDINNPDVATNDYFAARTILTPTNASVQSVNEAVSDRLRGEEQVYLSTDSVQDANDGESTAFVETEVLNSINVSGIPPHRLTLKRGAPIMMIRNLNPDAGLCNGTRLRIVELKPHVIHAQIMTGEHHGKDVFIPRIIFISDEDIREFPFRLRRKQFPIVPAFAMTINKAQGQTVQNMGLYLSSSCFSHGQLYVALSRVTSRQNVKVLIEHPDKGNDGEVYTENIVYRQVFD